MNRKRKSKDEFVDQLKGFATKKQVKELRRACKEKDISLRVIHARMKLPLEDYRMIRNYVEEKPSESKSKRFFRKIFNEYTGVLWIVGVWTLFVGFLRYFGG